MTATVERQLTGPELAEARRMIREGMRYLSALCADFATEQNGVGFDKADTLLGHEFAALDLAEYDEEITSWGYQRCHKYRKQLDGLAPNFFDGIPRVEQVRAKGDPWWKIRRAEKKEAERRAAAEEAERQRLERLKGRVSVDPQGRACYWYPFDPDRNDLVRQLGARWDSLARCWSGPITKQNADGILALERRDFIIPDDVRAACAAAKAAPEAKPQRTAVLVGTSLVRFRYPRDRAINDAVKALRATWNKEASDWDWSVWETKLTAENAAGILALARFDFQIDDKIAQACAGIERAAKEAADRAARNLAESSADTADITIPGFVGNLYPFQRAGIRYMVRERRVLNADQPGLGKTRQAIGAVQALGAYPVVVVCPASVKYNWEREWHACAPGHSVRVLSGTTPLPLAEYGKADVQILNYDILDAHMLPLKGQAGLNAVIVDESHYIKNAKAGRTQRVTELVAGVENRFFLTGTPVLNRPVELLSQLSALGRIGDVMGEADQGRAEWRFLKQHCGAWDEYIGRKRIWHFDGAYDLDVLNRNMRRTCYVRREKAEVLKELPPKRRVVVPVELTNRAEYDRLEDDFLAMVEEQAVRDAAFQASLEGKSEAERQRMIADRRDGANRAKYLMKITALKKCAAKGKLQAIKEWAGDFLDSGQKLVMFGWHRETVQMLAKAFGAPTVMGGDSAEARQASVDRFQTDPATQAIACNIVAAGEGITLTAASDTMFAELGWNPGKMEQAEDRVHRIGQQADSVTAWYLIAQGTLEEKLYRLIWSEKYRVTRGANDGVWGEGTDDPGDLLDDLIQAMRHDS